MVCAHSASLGSGRGAVLREASDRPPFPSGAPISPKPARGPRGQIGLLPGAGSSGENVDGPEATAESGTELPRACLGVSLHCANFSDAHSLSHFSAPPGEFAGMLMVTLEVRLFHLP